MESKPVQTILIHDLRSKLCDLYENDCIFDKFECTVSGDGSWVSDGLLLSACWGLTLVYSLPGKFLPDRTATTSTYTTATDGTTLSCRRINRPSKPNGSVPRKTNRPWPSAKNRRKRRTLQTTWSRWTLRKRYCMRAGIPGRTRWPWRRPTTSSSSPTKLAPLSLLYSHSVAHSPSDLLLKLDDE